MKYILSPYLNIYKFPITAVSSITNRITGLYLSGMYITCGFLCIQDVDIYSKYNKLTDINKNIINYNLIFPVLYHSFGGIRHLIWDKYPSFLNNKSVVKSSYILFTSSILGTLIF